MKEKPLKGDWIHLLSEDLVKVDMTLDDEENIARLRKNIFKNKIKKDKNSFKS